MGYVTWSVPGRRLASSLWILAATLLPAVEAARAIELTTSQKRAELSPREANFLKFVFAGDEAKAVEYAQVAGINPNAIRGEPLSTWFYGLAPVANINVQRIVFERFRQNPNPPQVGDMEFLNRFCDMPPLPQNIRIAVQGTPEQKAALEQEQESARRIHADRIMAGFRSLLGYGLKNKAILTRIFVGCVSNRMIPKTTEYYNLMLAPMIKAGANIDGDDAYRPLLNAVSNREADLVSQLVLGGADVDYHLPSRFGLPYGQGACQPRADQSLYRHVFDYTRPGNSGAELRIIGMLYRKGLSPLKKWGFDAAGGCKYASLYDVVLDTGNLTYAAQIKEIPDIIAKQQREAGVPVQASAQPANQTAPAAAQFGAWKVTVEDGKPVGVAKNLKADSADIQGIRLECAAGRLEYVPVSRRALPKTLWVSGMDDIHYTIALTSGRVTGADNVALSKEFLASEANAKRNGQKDWAIGMSLEGEDDVQAIAMGGFSQMRSYMLANCRKQG